MNYLEGRKAVLFMWAAAHRESMTSHGWLERELIAVGKYFLPLRSRPIRGRDLPLSVLRLMPTGAHTEGMKPFRDSNYSHNDQQPDGISKYIIPILVMVVDQIDPDTAPGPLEIPEKYRRLARMMLR